MLSKVPAAGTEQHERFFRIILIRYIESVFGSQKYHQRGSGQSGQLFRKRLPRPAASKVESFDNHSWPDGRLATEKRPYLKELEAQFNTRTFTFPAFGTETTERRITTNFKTKFCFNFSTQIFAMFISKTPRCSPFPLCREEELHFHQQSAQIHRKVRVFLKMRPAVAGCAIPLPLAASSGNQRSRDRPIDVFAMPTLRA